MENEGSISVSELNLMVSEAIHRDPRTRSLTVRGEVSGFRHHIASGHWYFSLKDDAASVSCAMYRSNTLKAKLRPKDGDSVLADGYVDIYAPQGKYQLYVTGLRPAGQGDLYIRLEALKRKLAAEGLFDPGRKKPLPMCPRKVAVVTSRSGAALQDILKVSAMRSPFIPIMLVPAAVQGNGAGAEIARGIRTAAAAEGVDVIIVARGGGSAEDLWCFNEEAVARAVAESPVPVVSGVGHQIDTTLCDLAADAVGATPSNAAEIVFPDRRELLGRTEILRAGLARAAGGRLHLSQIRLNETVRKLAALSPANRLALIDRRRILARERLVSAALLRTEREAGRRERAEETMNRAMRDRIARTGQNLLLLRKRMEAMNPRAVLDRGYAMVLTEGNRILATAEQARKEKDMILQFSDGQVAVAGKETQ